MNLSSIDSLLACGSGGNGLGDASPEETIGRLAQGLRIRRAYCLAYLASILGSVAGPVAGLKGFFGERHDIACSLVLDSPVPSLEQVLRAMFLEPLLRYSDLLRLASHSAHRAVLDSFDEEYSSDRHADGRSELAKGLVEQTTRLLKPDSWEFDEIAAAAGRRRQLSQLESPSLVVTSPAPGDLERILSDVLDRRPLILDPDGRILEGALIHGKRGDGWRQLVEELGRYQGIGSDVLLKKSKEDAPGVAARIRAPFLFHLNGNRLGESLNEPALAALLSHAVMIHPATAKRENAHLESVKAATNMVREAIKGVILARRNGAGVVYEIRRPEPKLLERMDAYQDWLDGIDEEVRRFCLGLHSLPYSLLWTALVLAGRSLGDDAQGRLHIPVMEAAQFLAKEHVELIRTALHEHRLRAQVALMEDFLRRVAQKAPCPPRDIYRTFRDQRREVHAPILNGLLDVGALRYREQDRKLVVVPEAGPPWDLRVIARSFSYSTSN